MSHSAGQCDSSGMEESLNARIVRDDAPEAAMRRLKDSPKHALEVTLGYFDDPLIGACDRFYQSDEWASVRALLPVRKGRALDLGAGRGIASYALARDGWDVTASEPDTSDLIGAGAIRRLAPEASLSINVVEEFGENLSFSDAVFDLVYCRQVLHHADNLYAMCREIARILKPGGIFLATREHVISKPEDLPAFLEKHLLHRLHGRENAHLLREYTDSIENAGLRLLRALGPMESVINYYPMSYDDWWSACAAPLFRLFGYRGTQLLANEKHVAGRALLRWLAARKSRSIDTPGRMYSFLAEKKGVRQH